MSESSLLSSALQYSLAHGTSKARSPLVLRRAQEVLRSRTRVHVRRTASCSKPVCSRRHGPAARGDDPRPTACATIPGAAPATSRDRPDVSPRKLAMLSAVPGYALFGRAYAFVGGGSALYLH